MNMRRRSKLAILGAICLWGAWGSSGYFAQRVVARKDAAVRAIREASIEAKAPKTAVIVSRKVPAVGSWHDTFLDGTPDFLRLDSAADREAFRGWFALIAEFEALRPPADVPPEIADCAALLRYAYRNALRAHDQAWTVETGIEPESAPGAIAKYHYPSALLGASLFRVSPGPASPDDGGSGVFAEFADAKTLAAFNTVFVSRDVQAARPGDILFYRQLEQDEPFHSMAYVGASRWLADPPGDWTSAAIVYHTGEHGPAGNGMRRVTLADLLRHPSPRWRPVPGNPNFLGVYRWNILRGAD
jgi:uncharacterized protein YfaT (DUF1175 family)